MRTGLWRRHITGMSMVGEDMPQLANRVDLDPTIRDVYGFPVPRITHSSHQFEIASSAYFGPLMTAACLAAPGAVGAAFIPIGTAVNYTGGDASVLAGPAATAHIMGTMRMGDDPAASVVDGYGRMHEVPNVVVADGSVFVSSGGFNPTLTIMALALRASGQI
jgi:choline dehydrogenase-like flavoprotein